MRGRSLVLGALVVSAVLVGWLTRPGASAPAVPEAAARLGPEPSRTTECQPPQALVARPGEGAGAPPPEAVDPPPGSAAGSLPSRIVVGVRVDGEPRLPVGMLVRVDGRLLAPLEYEEDDARAEVRIPVGPGDTAERLVRILSREHLPAEVRASLSRPATADLVTGGRVHVRHGEAPDGRLQLGLFLWKGRWTEVVASETPPHWNLFSLSLGESAFVGLAAGRYQVRELVSGLASAAVEVVPGQGVVVDLDLASLADVEGRVEAPAGAELRVAQVLAEGPSVDAEAGRPVRGVVPAEGRGRVGADGRFRVRARRGETLRLTVVHPHLRTDPSAGIATVRVGIDRPVLRLVEGPEIRFRLDGVSWSNVPRDDVIWFNQMQVDLVPVGPPPGAQTLRVQPLVEEGLARVGVPQAGRWIVQVDYPHRMPFSCEVLVPQGVVDLGTVTFSRGSWIRCRGVVAGRRPCYVLAAGESPAPYRRSGSLPEPGGDAVVLGGFAAGAIHVRLVRGDSQETVAERTVEVDGVHDAEVDFGGAGEGR